MAALIISNTASFGNLTNQIVGKMTSLNASIPRLAEAIATASADYEGTPGTQFENSTGAPLTVNTPNNFGVVPNPAEPGANGQSYSYAVGQLQAEWDKFWTLAQPYVAALDNGGGGGGMM